MIGLSMEERYRFDALLPTTSQEDAMAQIPQFSQAEVYHCPHATPPAGKTMGVVV